MCRLCVCVLVYEVKGGVSVREWGNRWLGGGVNKTTLNERFVLLKFLLVFLLSMNYQFDRLRRPLRASLPASALSSSRCYRTNPRRSNRSVPIPSTGDASDSRIAPVRVCAGRRCAAVPRRQPSQPESRQQYRLEYIANNSNR